MSPAESKVTALMFNICNLILKLYDLNGSLFLRSKRWLSHSGVCFFRAEMRVKAGPTAAWAKVLG
jgi:hypothetical protein